MSTSAILLTLALADMAPAADRPNVLFIMSDDHTTQAIGAYGSRLAELNPTPNIDLLAQGGMRFDGVFCNNSICTPSRASIITGQYSQTNRVLDLTGNIPPGRQYLPIEMSKAGYHTAMIGKWHLKQEPAAFDYYCVLPGQGKYFNPTFRVRGDKPWPRNTIARQDQHSSDAITDISLEWLKNGWDGERPFFLMHHFKAPHDMFQNAPRYDSYLEDVTIPEPDNLHDQPADGFGSVASRGFGSGLAKGHENWRLGQRLGIDQTLSDSEYTRANYQKYLKRYLRCVKGVDDNVGRLIDFLRETGELDNTVIMYTGDQGFFLGEHDLMDKRWIYEEAMRMPFIVHWPKVVEAGTSNDWLINNTDFAPTMLSLAGVETPDIMQGHSFVSGLRGATRPADWRTATYYRYWMHMAHALRVPAHFGIRTERYKLIFFYGCTPSGQQQTPVAWELYDLQDDPHEMRNQYNNPDYSDIVAELTKTLWKTRRELNETDRDYPKIQAIIDAHKGGRQTTSTLRQSTELWQHLSSVADLAETRYLTATFQNGDDGSLLRLRPVKDHRRFSAWATIPPPEDGWDLAVKENVAATATNSGPETVDVVLWVVSSDGWDAVGSKATLKPGESQKLTCDLRKTFPDGTPKLDPGRIREIRVMLQRARSGAEVEVEGLVASGTAAPWVRPEHRLDVPEMEEGKPAAGRRVRYQFPSDAGTAIYSALYLPPDWKPGESYPVIVEYPGNIFYRAGGCWSTGRPEQCAMGYGITKGNGSIWISLPFLDLETGDIAESGFGSNAGKDTTAHALAAIDHICTNWGGDRNRLSICGFSRGSIACGYIGLSNDEIGSLWKGIIGCQHYDGSQWHQSNIEGAVERAPRFQGAAIFQVDNNSQRYRPVQEATRPEVEWTWRKSGLGYHATAMFLDDRPLMKELRVWYGNLIDDQE